MGVTSFRDRIGFGVGGLSTDFALVDAGRGLVHLAKRLTALQDRSIGRKGAKLMPRGLLRRVPAGTLA